MRDFLANIVPQDGWVCIANHDGRTMRHRFYKDAYAAANAANSLPGDVYFAFASFKERKRRKPHVQSVQVFVLDVDTGKAGGYATKQDALNAIVRLHAEGTLPFPSVLIDSGGGFHLYWLLDRTYTREEWDPLARAFRSRLQVVDPKLAVDVVRVTDAAGLLRVPGTRNMKRNLLVSVVHADYNRRFSPSELIGKQAELVPASPFAQGYDSSDDLMASPPSKVPASFLFAGCPQFMDACVNQASESYEAWWCSIQLCAFTEEGEKLAHFISHKYPKYSPEETSRKFEQAATSRDNGVGPVTCEVYAAARGSAKCMGCKHRGHVKSPIVAAQREQTIKAEIAARAQSAQPPDPAAQATPAPHQAENVDGVTTPPASQDHIQALLSRLGAHVGATFEFNHGTGEVMAVLTVGKAMQVVPACPRLVKVLGRVDGEEPIMLLGVYDKTGSYIERQLSIEASVLSTNQSVHKFFKAFGYTVPAGHDLIARAFRLYAAAIAIDFNTCGDVIQGVGRMGWRRNGFVVGEELITKTGTTPVEPSEELSKVSMLFTTGGDAERHKEAFAGMLRLLVPEAKLALLAALASPLMALTGETGLFVHLTGPSGCGKSTLLRIAAGLYGRPISTHFTPNDTRASREARLYLYRHLPALFDEITPLLTGDETVQHFIYSLTNGEGYHRARRDGSLQRPKSGWQLITLTTANASMHAKFQSRNSMVDEALMLRVMELPLENDTTLKSRNDLGMAQRWLHWLDGNYGWVGREFIQRVVARKSEIEKRLKDLVAEWNLKYTQQYRFIHAGLACVQVAMDILEEMGMSVSDEDLISIIGQKLRTRMQKQQEAVKAEASAEALVMQLVAYVKDCMAIFSAQDKKGLDVGSMTGGYVLQARPVHAPKARALMSEDGVHIIVARRKVAEFCQKANLVEPSLIEMLTKEGYIVPVNGKQSFIFDLNSGIPDSMGNVAPATVGEPCYLIRPPINSQLQSRSS